MVATTSLSGSNLPIRSGDNLLIGVRPEAPTSRTGQKPTTLTPTKDELSAEQGAKMVGTALKKATEVFAKVSELQATLKQAADPASAPKTKAETEALNAKITTLSKEVTALAAEAKVGKSNLLSDDDASVTVKTASGLKVTVAAQSLDANGLGISDLKVTDQKSAREALSKVSLAVGQSQLAVFRLQTADGATGTAQASPSTNLPDSASSKALEAVKKAVDNQTAFNSSGYSSASASKTSPAAGGILSLFA
jgi:hypothetical protein